MTHEHYRPFIWGCRLLAGLFPAVFLAAGCAEVRKPDLSRTTGIARLEHPRHPLILIHGFLGSKLRDRQTHKVAWGTMANVLTGRVSEALALPMEEGGPAGPADELEPYEIYRSLWGVDYYRKILRTLKEAGGYQIGDIRHPRRGDNAFIFVYDWRQDNVVSARQLAEAIAGLKRESGNPDLRFDLLTHSQGGLIARYYVLYGEVDVLDAGGSPVPTMAGAANVGKVIMLGTPNRGCLEALKILHLGIKKFFRPMPPDVVFTMPSLYQMLPPQGEVVFATIDGTPVNLDLYDPRTWVRENWSVFSPEMQKKIRRKLHPEKAPGEGLAEKNRQMEEFLARMLRRAERFHQALNVPAPRPAAGVAYYAFGSDCISTLKTAVVLQEGHKREILFGRGRFRHEKIGDQIARILYGPGDGTVLMQSLLDIPGGGEVNPPAPGTLNLSSAFFICESHGLLPNDPIFQNNLFYLLLWSGTQPPPAPPGTAPRVGL